MKSLFLFTIAVLSVSSCFSVSVERTSRIFNGEEVPIERAPFMMQILHQGKLVCGGALIHPQYVLTAGHCFNDYFYRLMKVRGGCKSLTDPGIERSISSVDIHPKYNANDMSSDMAILKLTQPMQGTNIAVVPITKRPIKAGEFVQTFGWGRTTAQAVLSNSLRAVRVAVLPQEKCKQEYGRLVEENMFCGSSAGGKTIYKGDSGSPVLCQGQVCGINAFITTPGVSSSAFTDVYALRQYIDESLHDLHELDDY